MRKCLVTSFALVLLAANAAWADVVVHNPFDPVSVFLVFVLEAGLAAYLADPLGLRPRRVFVAWLATTLVTFALFVKFIAYLQEIPFIQRVIAAAACVVVLEALALYVMGLVPFLRHGRSGRLPATKTLAVSAFVNVGSMLTSLWMVSLFIFLSFMM
ncbi:MAG: hypothetical protein JSW47_21320 [Phycisphaerales bacterium]|nr:MAG: hypothetical protein JSW47_21320 [Phycisphaerales bacterium]